MINVRDLAAELVEEFAVRGGNEVELLLPIDQCQALKITSPRKSVVFVRLFESERSVSYRVWTTDQAESYRGFEACGPQHVATEAEVNHVMTTICKIVAGSV